MKKQRMFVKVMALTILLMSLPFVIPTQAGSGSLARVSASPSAMPDLTPDQIEAAVEEYFDAIGAFDVPRYVNTFAPDGVLEDPVGTPPVQGTQAISAYISAITAPFSEMKHKIQDINVCGHEAAVNWKIQVKSPSGKQITIDGMGVFNFNAQGKLQSVREFWDLQAFLAELQG